MLGSFVFSLFGLASSLLFLLVSASVFETFKCKIGEYNEALKEATFEGLVHRWQLLPGLVDAAEEAAKSFESLANAKDRKALLSLIIIYTLSELEIIQNCYDLWLPELKKHQQELSLYVKSLASMAINDPKGVLDRFIMHVKLASQADFYGSILDIDVEHIDPLSIETFQQFAGKIKDDVDSKFISVFFRAFESIPKRVDLRESIKHLIPIFGLESLASRRNIGIESNSLDENKEPSKKVPKLDLSKVFDQIAAEGCL